MELSAKRTANNRAEWAREKWHSILSSFLSSDAISGTKARKLDQAYRIYLHYLFQFNGSQPRPTAPYKRSEKRARLQKRSIKTK